MSLSSLLIDALLALVATGLVAWVLREFATEWRWLMQPASAHGSLLQSEDFAQAYRELHSR